MGSLYKGTPKEVKQFEWREGDKVIVCFENAELKAAKASGNLYSNTVLRVIAGPLGDRNRNAGPHIDASGKIHSRVIFDINSFGENSSSRIDALLFALGHDGGVDINGDTVEDQERSWLRHTADREMVIAIKMETFNGRTRPRPESYARVTRAEWPLVAQAYAEFGTARGYGWTDEKDEPLHPWDPTLYSGAIPAVGGGAPPASRRGRSALMDPKPATSATTADVKPAATMAPAATSRSQEAKPAAPPATSTPDPLSDLKGQLELMTVAQVTEWLAAQPLTTEWPDVMRAEAAGKKRPKVLALINAQIAAAAKASKPAPVIATPTTAPDAAPSTMAAEFDEPPAPEGDQPI